MDAPSEHLRWLRYRIRGIPVSGAPAPWRHVGDFAVGGLTDVGFGQTGELLLVISGRGRGVFDCKNGERVARDPADDPTWHDMVRLEAEGIGPLAGERIRTAGMYGGGLPLGTEDGWSCTVTQEDWPDCSVFLDEPGSSVLFEGHSRGSVKLYSGDPVLVAGFSWSGRTFVVANSHTLHVYGR